MDQEAKYLSFGDLIPPNPAEAARPEAADACKAYDKKEAYLHGEGFHDLRLGVASDPDDIQKCMLCVSNQLQYAAEKALRKFCEQKGDFCKQTASHMLAPDSVVSFLASNLLKEQKRGCVSRMPKEVVQHKMAEMKFRKMPKPPKPSSHQVSIEGADTQPLLQKSCAVTRYYYTCHMFKRHMSRTQPR
jgi:hypothetical protein